MPTYGYRCQACQGEFDVWQRMSDAPKAACPVCGGQGKRLFFPAGLVFKGSGFYVTDNRRGSGANGSSAGADSKPTTSKPNTGSSSGGSTAASSAGNASGTSSE